MTNKEQRFHDFQNYFRDTGHRVEYNGVIYQILDAEDNSIISGNTSDEIYAYIVGWKNSHSVLLPQVELWKKSASEMSVLNNQNVKMYEKIIQDMGGESIEDGSLHAVEEVLNKVNKKENPCGCGG